MILDEGLGKVAASMANGGSLNGFTLLSNKGWQVIITINILLLIMIIMMIIFTVNIVINLMMKIVRRCTRIQPQGDSALQGPRPYILLRFKNITIIMMTIPMMRNQLMTNHGPQSTMQW